MTDRPEYARLTRPQARCVYKNFAAEMRVRGIRSYTIADALSLPRNSISNYLYEKKSLPLTVAINIRDKFFPDLTLEYLFERSVPGPSRGVSLQNINETDCKYPYICRDIDAGRVRVDEMAAAVNQSEIDLLVKFSRCALTIEEAITIRDRFFPGVDIKTLFEQSLS